MVIPARDTPKTTLWVSNLDLVMVRHHTLSVHFYKPDGSSNFFDPKVLKDALSEILVPFYPAAGRLQYDENGRLEIICNGKGVLFIEAEISCVMDDLVGDFTDSSKVPQLAPKVDYSGGISSYPLVAFQVTRFNCGGVSLGIASQHTLGDGVSGLHIINSWADMARGLPLEIPPFLDRTLLRARIPPAPTFPHVEFEPTPCLKNSIPTDPKPSNILSVFKITVDQLNTLKAKINENVTAKYSTYSILTAHIWRCVTKARDLEHDQAVRLFMPIDGRSRLQPPLPCGYFGNVILFITSTVKAGDLESEPIFDTVKRIDKVLKGVNNEYMRSAIDYIENVDDINTVVRGSDTTKFPSLTINSWVRLPLHESDFGWGRPVYARPASVGTEGKVFILANSTNDGSLSLVIRLQASHMKVFEELLYQF
ncbi:Transferase [Corchorus olitorius]|uniref:Transferase n=1 Tax=Corchorus olitorius TaxID=93759 RepID=A0A1R3HI89_9ROSI|nr:Transferase [Corchorus olitorius]